MNRRIWIELGMRIYYCFFWLELALTTNNDYFYLAFGWFCRRSLNSNKQHLHTFGCGPLACSFHLLLIFGCTLEILNITFIIVKVHQLHIFVFFFSLFEMRKILRLLFLLEPVLNAHRSLRWTKEKRNTIIAVTSCPKLSFSIVDSCDPIKMKLAYFCSLSVLAIFPSLFSLLLALALRITHIGPINANAKYEYQSPEPYIWIGRENNTQK